MEHIISTLQFLDRTKLDGIFSLAAELERAQTTKDCEGKILATVFYEPSTRTRFSFETAMYRLGGHVISSESAAQFSSAIKGETLEDSIRVVSGYADVIVLRHPEEGSAERASKAAQVPVINAGDGAGEHPTQALLDYYTILREQSRLDSLHLAFVGDLRYSRTVHSLLYLVPILKDIRLSFVSPAALQVPDKYKDYLASHNIRFEEFESLEQATPAADVFYITRVQKERFPDPAEYEGVKGSYVLDLPSLAPMKTTATIMHPLPRVHEITPEVDADPRAAYFRQTKNGVYVRMALLKMVLGS